MRVGSYGGYPDDVVDGYRRWRQTQDKTAVGGEMSTTVGSDDQREGYDAACAR